MGGAANGLFEWDIGRLAAEKLKASANTFGERARQVRRFGDEGGLASYPATPPAQARSSSRQTLPPFPSPSPEWIPFAPPRWCQPTSSPHAA